jgi:hypothetical protein
MPQRDQHNASDLQSQAPSSAEQCWNELVEQRLPANLETQARVLGAFQRVRELASAQVLLRALLCYVLSLSSLKHLSGWSRLVGVTSKVRIAPRHGTNASGSALLGCSGSSRRCWICA